MVVRSTNVFDQLIMVYQKYFNDLLTGCEDKRMNCLKSNVAV